MVSLSGEGREDRTAVQHLQKRIHHLRHWRSPAKPFCFSLFLTFRHVDQELGEAPILPGPRAIRRRHQSRKVARRRIRIGAGGAPSAPGYRGLGRAIVGGIITAGASGRRRGRDAPCAPSEGQHAELRVERLVSSCHCERDCSGNGVTKREYCNLTWVCRQTGSKVKVEKALCPQSISEGPWSPPSEGVASSDAGTGVARRAKKGLSSAGCFGIRWG